MNGFECCAGGGLGDINHGIVLAGDSIGPGLEITHNMFNGGSVSVLIVCVCVCVCAYLCVCVCVCVHICVCE
jgi:hypothetical protein